MSGISRRTLVNEVGGLILFSFLPISSAKAAQLVDLRIWPSPEYTRITLEHDVPIPFKYTMVRNGSSVKMVVLIEGLTLTTKLKNLVSKQQPNDPYISGITASQYSSKTVQLVINFKQDVDPQVFSLKPFGEYKYRLVFDLYPAVEKDPIMALIRKEESEPDAIGRILAQVAEGQQRMEENRAEAEQDSIGDLIAGITSGNIVPMKPGDLGYMEQPSKEKPKSSKAPVTKQPKKEQPKTTPRRGRERVLVVMVDPGHGGEDPGAVGKRYRTKEKEVVLSISRILVAELNKVQGFKAMLTRDRDYFVPLNRRVQKARAAKADFFVSVHADAWVKPTARGSSIFALDTRGRVSTQNKWLARNQNNADL
ncbi:N-acetylmuramoyl-L-alanine amidase, partial [Turicimonas muris]